MPRNRSFWVMLSTVCVVITALLVSQPWHAQAEPIADSNAIDTDAEDDLFADRGDAAPDDSDRDDEFNDEDFDEDFDEDEGEFERDGEPEDGIVGKLKGEDEDGIEFHFVTEELEVRYLELETVTGIANIADSEVGSAALALAHVEDLFEEDLSGLTTFLSDALNEADNPGIQRLLRFKLAELHFDQDQPDQARTQLRHLITGK